MNSRKWCIVVTNRDGQKIIGPFDTPQAAALYATQRLSKPIGQVAVIVPMVTPEE